MKSRPTLRVLGIRGSGRLPLVRFENDWIKAGVLLLLGCAVACGHLSDLGDGAADADGAAEPSGGAGGAGEPCSAGDYLAHPSLPGGQPDCRPCASGTFTTSGDAESCQPWSVCETPWTPTPGSSTADVGCADQMFTFGTASYDEANAVAVNAAGEIYVGGSTIEEPRYESFEYHSNSSPQVRGRRQRALVRID